MRRRNTDPPATSRLAHRRAEQSGSAQTHRERVLDAVHRWPGLTSRELSTRLEGLDRHQIARVLPQLEQANPPQVRKGKIRVCEVVQTLANTWHPVGPQRSLFSYLSTVEELVERRFN